MADAPPLYYLDAQSQPQGPLPREQLAGLVAAGELSGATLAWHEGAPEWAPLEALLGGGQPGGGGATLARGAVRAAAPSRAGGADDELAAFQAEVSRLEAQGPAGDDERPGTPEETSFVDDDGTAYVWDAARRAFVPQEGGAAPSAPSAAALVPDYDPSLMVFPDDDQPPLLRPPPRRAPQAGGAEAAEGLVSSDEDLEDAAAPADAATLARRQRESAVEREKARLAAKADAKAAAKKVAEGGAGAPPAPKVNTSVYVTGLPEDATPAELAEVFARCGLLKEDEDGKPRVKLYTDKATGMPKGDGLVIYLKEPSVALACTILDGATFRPGQGKPMSVTPATFQPKPPKAEGGAAGGTAGGASGGGGAKKAKPAAGAGRKRKGGPGGDKALGWDGFDDVYDARKVVVVLRGMFTPAEMAAGGPAAAEALRAETLAECASFGPVDKARVFERNPDGIVTVKFREPDAARACVARMAGRFFAGRALQAELYDGRTDFEPRARPETEEEQTARLERYAAELEAGFDLEEEGEA